MSSSMSNLVCPMPGDVKLVYHGNQQIVHKQLRVKVREGATTADSYGGTNDSLVNNGNKWHLHFEVDNPRNDIDAWVPKACFPQIKSISLFLVAGNQADTGQQKLCFVFKPPVPPKKYIHTPAEKWMLEARDIAMPMKVE